MKAEEKNNIALFVEQCYQGDIPSTFTVNECIHLMNDYAKQENKEIYNIRLKDKDAGMKREGKLSGMILNLKQENEKLMALLEKVVMQELHKMTGKERIMYDSILNNH